MTDTRTSVPVGHIDDPASCDRGVNRVNQHTLDMRIDRDPGPIKHYHGTVSTGPDDSMPNSEIALVLPRNVYNRPRFTHDSDDRTDDGWVKIYNDPVNDPTDTTDVPVKPGSMLVTPATEHQVYGHCFENTFAMLVAIPGFVAPLHYIEKPDRAAP